MGTTFSELAQTVRPILGDTDLQRPVYSESTIMAHFRLYAMMEGMAFSDSGFTDELTGSQKAMAILKVARGILSPQDNNFMYKTPIVTVSRSGGVMQMISWIDNKIAALNVDKLFLSTTEFDAIFKGPYNYITEVNKASGALSANATY